MFRNKNKTKVKVKAAKGGGPIRKVKAVIGVGTILVLLKALGVDQHLPQELMEPLAEFTAELVALLLAAVAYYTRPAADDGVEIESQ